LTFIEYIYDL